MSDEKIDASTGQSGKLVLGMGSCYALGTYTDNFYKQAAIFLAAASGLAGMQSSATVIFSLPYILFSAWAGWLADKIAKKYIVIGAKTVELLALLGGSYMLINENWDGIRAVLFFMGLQATVFSPALNGSIPENFADADVPKINSYIKTASTAAVLAGIGMAGIFLDMRPFSLGGYMPSFGLDEGPESGVRFGRIMAAAFVVIIAVLGLLTAFTLKKKQPLPAADGQRQAFPWSGPLDSIRHTLECRKDPQLFLVLMAEAYFYGIAAIAVISIANLATDLSYSNTIAGFLSAVLTIGIAVGAIIAGRYPAECWRKLLRPSAAGMAVMLFLVSLSPYILPIRIAFINIQLLWLFVSLFLCGVFGGIYLIPLASFIQIRPSVTFKGRVLGVSNFLSFVAMAFFGAAFYFISMLEPAQTFAFYALTTFIFAYAVIGPKLRKLPDASLEDQASSPIGTIAGFILSLRYNITVKGLDKIPSGPVLEKLDVPAGESAGKTAEIKPGILILPNHPALIDPIIVYTKLAGLKPRPLADESQMKGLLQAFAARKIRAVTIPDMSKDGRKGAAGVQVALNNIKDALASGDNILLYPSGRLYRSGYESLGGNTAVSRLLAEVPGVRVLLVRTSGLWGSSFSYAHGRSPRLIKALLRGMATVFMNLLFLTPRRRVSLECVEPLDLPRSTDKNTLNAYLENFYNETATPAFTVPRFFWQGSEPVFLPEEDKQQTKILTDNLPDSLLTYIFKVIKENANLPANYELSVDQALSADLHMDSLAIMDLATAIEAEYGFPITGLEALHTVGDCLLAAQGNLKDQDEEAKNAICPEWFSEIKNVEKFLTIPQNTSDVVSAFLRKARQAPRRILSIDRSGAQNRRQVLTSVLAIAARFETLPGKRLGLMLPATPAALVVWLAALLAGKEPVMLNWTVGLRNLRHCIAISGITHAVSAGTLIDKLERMNIHLNELPLEWVAVDQIAVSLSTREKLSAAIRSFSYCFGISSAVSTAKVPATAGILFTSGSESSPKGVPLSHENVMVNSADLVSVLTVDENDKLLAMLPPFHSFGFLAGLVLPAVTGLRSAYYPNPTESAPLVFMVRDYKLTLLGATPTFLEAMLNRAKAGGMESVRYAFIGAEKCQPRVYQAFAESCPEAALCEGYGITECSPVVSVNRPENPIPGSIGKLLPSVSACVVKETEGDRRSPVEASNIGMLLVKGKSIFQGYLGESPNPFVNFQGDNWYRTGDLVSMDKDGQLTFQGRLKRFVKIGGEMISLPQIEEILQKALQNRRQDDGLPFLAVEAPDDNEGRISAFVTFDANQEELNSLLRAEGLSSLYSIKNVIRLDAIPILGTGKTDYQELKRRL